MQTSFNCNITAKLSTLINSASTSKVSKEIEKILLSTLSPDETLNTTKKFKFTGVGNYNHNEEFDLLNDVGLLWRLESRTGGWDQCGYDFVPWSGYASVELKSNVFLDMSYFKGKLQNVNIRYNSN
jgi:hypothetical protein